MNSCPSRTDLTEIQRILWGLNSRFLTLILLTCSALFVPVDFWYKQFRYVGGAMPLPQVFRAAVMALCILYISRKGVKLGKYGFELGFIFTSFIILWVIHGLIGNFSYEFDFYFVIKSSFFIFTTVAFYRLVLANSVDEKILSTTYVFVIIFASIYAISLMLKPDVEAGQNAGSYIILWCIPLLLRNNRLLPQLVVVLGFVAIFITVKRGPAVALFAGLLAYFFVGLLIRQKMLNIRKIISVFILFAGLAASFYWQYDRFESRFEEFARVDRSSQAEVDRLGSGRVLMARVHLSHYLEGSMIDQLIGFGNMEDYIYYGEYRKGLGVVAHSTWIETIHNYGAIGVFLLAGLFYKIFKILVLAIRLKSPLAQPLAMGMVTFFLTSFYSSVLFSPESIYFGFLVAFCMAKIKKKCWGIA